MALYITLSVALLLILLLFSSLKVEVKYNEELEVAIKLWFLKIFSLEQSKTKKKKNKEDPKHKTKKSRGKFKLSLKEKGVKGFLTLLKELAEIVFYLGKKVFKKIQINDLKVKAVICEEDAAKTAILYGKVNASLHSFLGALFRGKPPQKYKIDVVPLFADGKTNVHFYLRFSILIINLLIIILTSIIKFAKFYSKNKEGAKNGRKPN